jgi:hypothetical protein
MAPLFRGQRRTTINRSFSSFSAVTEPLTLPEPAKLEVVDDKAPFTVEAALIHRLGTESVSDKVLSMIELIKNSYDADANTVKIILRNLRTGNSEIIVIDDGSGMKLDNIREGWLRIATSIKLKRPKSPIHERRVLGQKGIGRFAVENLSRKTIITTYPRKEKQGYRISFDWNKFAGASDLSSLPNIIKGFEKDAAINGTKIHLQDLRNRWTEDDVHRLRTYIRSLTPPEVSDDKFQVIVDTDEFEDLSGNVESDFLENAVFVFDAKLSKTGRVQYEMYRHGEDKPFFQRSEKITDFKCGPVDFKIYFYYRQQNKLASYGIRIGDLESITDVLDNYGGIKIYRDGIRISGFGNPDDDWASLDALSRNNPSLVPARNQVISTVNITSEFNPEINDTTTRENIIKNASFQDLLKFIHSSIDVFVDARGDLENKRQPASKKPKPSNKYAERVKENVRENKDRKALLDFATDYPNKFYINLEEEINACYITSLSNATLMLSRKMVENLLYNIIEEKFPKDMALRYDVHRGRTLYFSVLIENLQSKLPEFNKEQKELIDRLLVLIKQFRRDANATTHKVIEYMEGPDDVDKLKIMEIVQLELMLIKKIKAENR